MKTVQEAITAWNSGEPVPAISMGGMGDDYERDIYLAVFGILENANATFYDKVSKILDEALAACEDPGWSGAQVGAAKQVAWKALARTWGGMVETIPTERLITVRKFEPHP